MKKWIACAVMIMTSVMTTLEVSAQNLPAKKDILQSMRMANSYFMSKWPDAGKTIITNKERQSNIWTRSVYYEGLMALYTLDRDQAYYDYAVQWGEKHKWGLVGGVKTRHADNHCAGQTYIDLYLLDKKEERIKDIKESIDAMVHSDKKDDWSWVDAIQMAMPVFTKLGVLYHDTSYFNKMYDLYSFSKHQHGGNGLYSSEDHLWWRDKDFVPPYKEPNGKNCYWSRGNGWVFAALARSLEILPKTDPHYKEYLQDFKDMAAALLPIQREDGFWNVSLHDPNNYGGKETSGTSLFAYGFAWGINHGFLNKKQYMPAIAKAWNGIVKDALHENGVIGFLQSTGKEPKEGQPVTYDKIPDFEDYGLGCFLLAGVEISKLK
jgi:rhamnogalacturonyl hydrolase YesR